MQQKAFEDIKNEVIANPLVQPYSLQKKQQILLTPLKKPLAGFYRKEARRTSSQICIKKVDSNGAKLLKCRARSTGNCVCGHKIEAFFSFV